MEEQLWLVKKAEGGEKKVQSSVKLGQRQQQKRDVRPGKHIQGRKRRETVERLRGGGGERLENEGGDEVKYVAWSEKWTFPLSGGYSSVGSRLNTVATNSCWTCCLPCPSRTHEKKKKLFLHFSSAKRKKKIMVEFSGWFNVMIMEFKLLMSTASHSNSGEQTVQIFNCKTLLIVILQKK